jgi:alkylation response protein AidB-like acyl-CoA dehydrogenase
MDVPKHQGMSFFIVDMRQPGVETRPIRQINGNTGFTETFFVNAEIPDEYRLDAEGQGWAVAMTVLAAERTTTGNIAEGGARRTSPTSARSLMKIARETKRENGAALDSAVIRARIADFHARAQGIRNFTVRMGEETARTGRGPLNIPVIKLSATARLQEIHAFIMDLEEAGGLLTDTRIREDNEYAYITSASSRIAGGADEVLKNQLAERALGMPGDARADKDVPFGQLPF